MFVEHRISALPVINEDEKVVDIYAKFDVIVSILNKLKYVIKFWRCHIIFVYIFKVFCLW